MKIADCISRTVIDARKMRIRNVVFSTSRASSKDDLGILECRCFIYLDWGSKVEMFSVGSLSAGRNSSMVELSWDPETDKTGPCLDFSIFSRQSVVRVVIVGLLYLAVFYRICRVTITKPLTGSKTEGDRERWERQKETEREMGKTEGDRERKESVCESQYHVLLSQYP